MTVNVFCNSFGVFIIKKAGVRAGTLFLINLIPVYFSFYLSFLSDLFGIFLPFYRFVHGSTGVISVILDLVYIIVNGASNSSFSYGVFGQLPMLGNISKFSMKLTNSIFITQFSVDPMVWAPLLKIIKAFL